MQLCLIIEQLHLQLLAMVPIVLLLLTDLVLLRRITEAALSPTLIRRSLLLQLHAQHSGLGHELCLVSEKHRFCLLDILNSRLHDQEVFLEIGSGAFFCLQLRCRNHLRHLSEEGRKREVLHVKQTSGTYVSMEGSPPLCVEIACRCLPNRLVSPTHLQQGVLQLPQLVVGLAMLRRFFFGTSEAPRTLGLLAGTAASELRRCLFGPTQPGPQCRQRRLRLRQLRGQELTGARGRGHSA